MKIAEVAFNLPLERTFHYLIPPDLSPALQPGMRVAVSFGPRKQIGFVVRRVSESRFPRLKAIERILDPIPVIDDERWDLARWVSHYYFCSLGEALAAMVPSALRLSSQLNSAPSAAESMPAASHKSLSPSQQSAFARIEKALASSDSKPVLLHGVTGSGKTELYLQAIDRVLAEGRSAICLIPEIALTAQTIDRFQERFGSRVAVWHSQLTQRQRAQQWWRMSQGVSPVVVGARSAIFAPVKKLGLVVVDEEHEPTYKQQDIPRYHVREVALSRARLGKAAVILGSATPSIESAYAARKKQVSLLRLPERIGGAALAQVEVVDLKGEWAGRSRGGPLSNRLRQLIEQTMARDEQVMLLLNRRGFARVAQCQACGFIVRCSHCAIPLIYHAAEKALLCHYCRAQKPLAEVCTSCKKGYLALRGFGTERVESDMHRFFPGASIARMDRDTMQKSSRHREVYEAFKTRQIGLLVGTQMIAKGWDIPQVTLVGVVSADTALNLPDFRAGERTFDLLTQMAGRAGRGKHPGRVVIQTYCPEHYAISAAAAQDYERFYQEEIRMRRQAGLPPFSHLVELTILGRSKPRAVAAAADLAEALRKKAGKKAIHVLGPVPHRIARLRGNFRVTLMLKAKQAEPMVTLLQQVLKPGRQFEGLTVAVDVDPL